MPPDIAIAPVIELSGVFVGALSGGLAAVRKQFDLFGILVLAWAAGLGGGLMRDLLIGATPPVGIADWRFIAVACLAGAVMYFFNPRLERARRMILVLDAGALALFAVSGTLKALELGLNGVAAVSAGIITGIGGGVLRDLLIGEVPVVLHQRQLYAVPAVVGAVLTAGLWAAGILTALTALGAVGVVFALRVAALRFRLQAPGPWVAGARTRKVGARRRNVSGRMER
ncbi:trimeric intracellular cation channel family protein [Pengzhenrongella frigida]|uniref:Trimeric intracellular cation channel family protein n=1 Tax=Pengzhenrongella frigida TaxID=1259133 RepID=A0A4Q5MZI4_9MICO|nr:TRIC cation channel family protein [Cellulomonas sp. HLT2-17]RYV50343.1 trimeric intracellular cation channel family protein [Cellulomonas sp. HLT2-17]